MDLRSTRRPQDPATHIQRADPSAEAWEEISPISLCFAYRTDHRRTGIDRQKECTRLRRIAAQILLLPFLERFNHLLGRFKQVSLWVVFKDRCVALADEICCHGLLAVRGSGFWARHMFIASLIYVAWMVLEWLML